MNGEVVRHVIVQAEVEWVNNNSRKSQASDVRPGSTPGMAPLGDRTTRNAKELQKTVKLTAQDMKILAKVSDETAHKYLAAKEELQKARQIQGGLTNATKEQLQALRKAQKEYDAIVAEANKALGQSKLLAQEEKRTNKVFQNRMKILAELGRIREKNLRATQKARQDNQFRPDSGLTSAAADSLSMDQRRQLMALQMQKQRLLQLSERIAVVDVEGKIKVEQSLARIAAKRKEILKLAMEEAGLDGGTSSRDSNPFSTGSKWVDAVNAKSFQFMITSFAFQMLKDGIESAASFASARGEGTGAEMGRLFRDLFTGKNTGRNDDIRKWAEDVNNNVIWALEDAFGAGRADSIAKAFGQTISLFSAGFLDPTFETTESRKSYEDRKAREQLLESTFSQKSEVQELLGMWKQVHGKAMEAARAEMEAAEQRLKNAKTEFGFLSAMEQRDVVDIAQRFKAGNAVTQEEIDRLLRIPGVRETSFGKEFSEKRANAGNFAELDRILGFQRDVADAKQKVDETAPVFNVGGVTVNLEAALEDLDEKLGPLISQEVQNRLAVNPLLSRLLGGANFRGTGAPNIPSGF